MIEETHAVDFKVRHLKILTQDNDLICYDSQWGGGEEMVPVSKNRCHASMSLSLPLTAP